MFRRERMMLTNWQELVQLLHPSFSLRAPLPPAPRESSTDWRIPVQIVYMGGDPGHTGREVGKWDSKEEAVFEGFL